MREPSERQRKLRSECADAAAEVVAAYDAEDEEGTMPNFHFKLGVLMGTVQMLMSANDAVDRGIDS